ncbi:hypothetical protein ACIA03_14825 [Nocardioides sp. NPDC051685]|uniref:hypothetical protein n=1 Tax=Nocardioides sp. NPDC051685 TaxID=3364334 RepID=UPI00378ED581
MIWLVFAISWVLSDDSGTIGRFDRIGLLALGVIAVLVSAMWMIAHRSIIAKQIVAAYPVGLVVFSEMDDRGFRIANALGETSWRWDQLDGARSNAGVLGIPDRLAVRADHSIPGLMPQLSVWVPRALMADDVLVRLGLPVAGTTPVRSQHRFPRGTAVTQARTWVVTADSQRRLAHDAWLALILEPKMLAVQVLLATAVAGQSVITALMILDGYGVRPTSILLPVAFALNIWAPWWMARREVRTLFPIGFNATLQVEDVGLRVLAARDERVFPWRTLQGSRLRRTALTYPGQVEPMARGTIPALLVPDDVLRRLGCRPAGTQLAAAEGASADQ